MTDTGNDAVVDLSMILPFFKALPREETAILLSAGKIVSYKKRATIFMQGDPATRLFIIISGWVKVHNINDNALESNVRLLTRGDTFGIDSIFEGSRHLFSAETVNECKLLEMPAEILRERMKTSADLAMNIISILSHKVKDMQIANACTALKHAPRRIACLLLRLTSWTSGRGVTLKLPYEKSVAAAQLGMDQATFSRALTRLEIFGVTSSNGEISIKDFEKLSEHCCSLCSISEDQCMGRRHKLIKTPVVKKI